MRILNIIDSLQSGGRERQLVQLVKLLSKEENFEVAVIVTEDSIFYDEIRNIDIKLFIVQRKLSHPFIFFNAVHRISNEFDPDIIHSWGLLNTLFCIPLKFLSKLKLVEGSIRDARKPSLFSKRGLLAKVAFHFADQIVGNSQAGLRSYGVDHLGKSKVIYNGIEQERFENLLPSEQVKEQYHIKSDIIIGMTGTFSKNKDYKTFLETADELSRELNNISFVCVGGGKCLEHYKNKYSHNKNIVFTGRTERVENIVNTFSIGVLLTNKQYHSEGISNVLLEYCYLNIPVIATDSGGTPEIFKFYEYGSLVKSNDKVEFKNKLLQQIDKCSKKQYRKKINNKNVVSVFNNREMVSKYIRLYTNCENKLLK